MWTIAFCAAVCTSGHAAAPAGASDDSAEELATIDYSGLRLLNAKLAADGSRVLLNLDHLPSRRSLVRVHDTATGKQLGEWERRDGATVIGDAISRDGRRVILRDDAAKVPCQIQLVDVGNGRVAWQVPSGPGDAAFAGADGEVVLVSHLNPDSYPGIREVFAVKVGDGKELWRKKADASPARLELSSDGKLAVAEQRGGAGLRQCVLDLSSGKVVTPLDGFVLKGLSDTYAFLGDRTEVVGLVHNVLTRWDAATGKVVGRNEKVAQLGRDGHAAFSPDGRRLYLRPGLELSVLDSLTGEILGGLKVPPGAYLQAASDTGVVTLQMTPIPSLRVIKIEAKASR